MSIWYEGEGEIGRSIDAVRHALDDVGEHFLGVTRRMPGLTSVDLVEQTEDAVTISTNEGVMRRANITKQVDEASLVLEYDEEYDAGSKITTTTHFVDEFTSSGDRVTHHLVMSDVTASGFLGFFYRRFGSSKIGKALMTATKAQLES